MRNQITHKNADSPRCQFINKANKEASRLPPHHSSLSLFPGLIILTVTVVVREGHQLAWLGLRCAHRCLWFGHCLLFHRSGFMVRVVRGLSIGVSGTGDIFKVLARLWN